MRAVSEIIDSARARHRSTVNKRELLFRQSISTANAASIAAIALSPGAYIAARRLARRRIVTIFFTTAKALYIVTMYIFYGGENPDKICEGNIRSAVCISFVRHNVPACISVEK